MATQMRRGQQVDFNPDKMLPGEWAVSLDRKNIYMCFSPGDVRRMSTYEEMVQNIQDATKDVAALFTAEVQAAILEAIQSAADADLSAQGADAAAARANTAADRANGVSDDLISKRDSGYFAGQRGSQWYSGTGITGTSTEAAIFTGSGVSAALVGDWYINTSTDYIYQCTVAGAASVAKWVYKGKIKGDIDKLQEKNQRLPKLVVILVGNNQASNAYVKGKVRIVRKLEYSTLL